MICEGFVALVELSGWVGWVVEVAWRPQTGPGGGGGGDSWGVRGPCGALWPGGCGCTCGVFAAVLQDLLVMRLLL